MIRDELKDSWIKNRARLYEEASAEVRRLVAKLPADLRGSARSIPVGFEDVPSRGLIDEGVDPDLMGLFLGCDVGEAFEAPHSLPPRILLFLENIWDEASADNRVFREEVRRTYLHEMGHYLGLDENDLLERNID